ncbi:MAG TPA: hypothetical protein VGP35_06515 [Terriglobales bacterium]|nr:hypothetical protein [Terriglobales bacterium]
MKRSMLGVLLVLTFVAVGIASAPPLTFTYTDVHANKTALETDTYAVNNKGVIAGDYVDSKSVQHGMILAGSKLTTVDNKTCEAISGTGGISFYGINSAGEAAGWCTNSKTGLDEGFVYSKGKFTAVNVPKSNGTQATGINDKGWVVGLYLDSANLTHGFVKVGTKYTTVDVKGDTNSVAWGVNNKGQITVYATNSAGVFDAYLVTGKTFKKINNPKAGTSSGQGTIVHTPSNVGDIDGTYYNTAGTEMGWLLHKGKYYDVVDPGGVTRADGLNDKSELVGRYGSGSFGGTGFKATYK